MFKSRKALGTSFQILLHFIMSSLLGLEAIVSFIIFFPPSALTPDSKSFQSIANVIYFLILGLILAFFYFQIKTLGVKRLIWCTTLFAIINIIFLPLTVYYVNLGR